MLGSPEESQVAGDLMMGALLGVTPDQKQLAIYNEAEGFFGVWEIREKRSLLDEASDYKSHKVVSLFDLGADKIASVRFGYEAAEWEWSKGTKTFGMDCEWQEKYNFKVINAWRFTDIIDTSFTMQVSFWKSFEYLSRRRALQTLGWTRRQCLPSLKSRFNQGSQFI